MAGSTIPFACNSLRLAVHFWNAFATLYARIGMEWIELLKIEIHGKWLKDEIMIDCIITM